MSEEFSTDDMKRMLDKAIGYVGRFVPAPDRAPTPGGGHVAATATGVLVAARAFVEALSDHERAATPGKTPGTTP